MNDGSELVSVFATGHDDRPVELRRRGDTRFVRKYHAGGAEVWDVAGALWASPFGGARTPPGLAEPLAWDPDALAFDSEFVEGDVLAGRGSLGRVAELLDEVAALSADLHDSGAGHAIERNRRASKLLRSLERKVGADHPVLDALATAAPADEELVPNHGDFSPRNILVTDRGLRLIDFDRVQLAGRGRDVAYFGAWCWATLWQRGETPTWELADALVARYLALRPALDGDALHLGFHRAASLVRIATGWSAFAGDEAALTALLDEAARQATGG
ncbi:MAG: phosphotransferase family protein [Acidimicrobiia bacterium]